MTEPPDSAIVSPRGTRKARKVRKVRGTAARAARVDVAVTRKIGRKCKTLRSNGRLTRKKTRRACTHPVYLKATGTAIWRMRLKHRLPAGSYVIRSRATAADGTRETTPAKVKVKLTR